MEMSGEYPIKAPRAMVWAALNDPEILKIAITGCEELVRDGDGFTASVVVKIGPVKARFGGRITLSDIDPPNGYTITGEGQGGAAGFARGTAKIKLEDDGGGTILKYTAGAQIGGKLAQIGSRLIEGTAKKMADDFFSAFAAAVVTQPDTPAAAQTEGMGHDMGELPIVATVGTPAGQEQKGLHPVIWIAGLTAILGGVLYFFVKR